MVISIRKIKKDELEKLSGGGVEWFGVGLGIVTLVVFISGIIEGYTNRVSDETCNWDRKHRRKRDFDPYGK